MRGAGRDDPVIIMCETAPRLNRARSWISCGHSTVFAPGPRRDGAGDGAEASRRRPPDAPRSHPSWRSRHSRITAPRCHCCPRAPVAPLPATFPDHLCCRVCFTPPLLLQCHWRHFTCSSSCSVANATIRIQALHCYYHRGSSNIMLACAWASSVAVTVPVATYHLCPDFLELPRVSDMAFWSPCACCSCLCLAIPSRRLCRTPLRTAMLSTGSKATVPAPIPTTLPTLGRRVRRDPVTQGTPPPVMMWILYHLALSLL